MFQCGLNASITRTICLVALFTVPQITAEGADAPKRANFAPVTVRQSGKTAHASFVRAPKGGIITVDPAPGVAVQPMDFFRSHGHLFGMTDADQQLRFMKAKTDQLGQAHTTFEQVYQGVKVFAGVLKVHQRANGDFIAANGDFFPIDPALNTVPTLNANSAADVARTKLGGWRPHIEKSELVIVDPGWYGDAKIGAHLAYHIILTDINAPLREAFFVDAHNGRILDQWTLLESALFRQIFDDVSQVIARSEGDGPTGDGEVDRAYDYSGDTYDYWLRSFNQDSYDDAGGTMNVTVHLVDPNCPNAFGGGGGAWFCDGLTTDDIVAHEWGHSLTEFTANLIYQNQSGQLNESYSDVWGELVDLLNGNAGFPGPPGGTPWPTTHPTGPGTDEPNTLRTSECNLIGPAVIVNSPEGIAGTYEAGRALFGPPLSPGGITGDVGAAVPALACTIIKDAGAIAGRIALVDRGDCNFTLKVKNCQNAGAIAVIVADNVAGPLFTMSGEDASITIPSAVVTQADGATIRAAVESIDTVNATIKTLLPSNVRWLMGEDYGALRDMWEPTCFGDPDRANSSLQTCNPQDNGGVHSGSGVPNHAFAILTDGKSFNGQTVTAIGPFKAAAVWYRALSVYLTPVSDFGDAYAALTASASDLVDQDVVDPRDLSLIPFTTADADEVEKALLATEMNTEGACGQSSCSNNAQCDDFLFCNGQETCNLGNGQCQAGVGVTCDDLNSCTSDSCDDVIGCTNDGTGVTDSCDDSNACTVNDSCQGDLAGTCAGTFHCRLFGDVFPQGPPQGNCVIDLDDILQVLAAFGDSDPCTNFPGNNLFPCGQACPPGIVDLDDILEVLASFSEDFGCPHPCDPGE